MFVKDQYAYLGVAVRAQRRILVAMLAAYLSLFGLLSNTSYNHRPSSRQVTGSSGVNLERRDVVVPHPPGAVRPR